MPHSELLTAVELEIMSILWRLGEGNVREVQGALAEERALAYTTVSTVLRILEKKGIVSNRKEGRGHVYVPQISKAQYESRSLEDILQNVFEGTPSGLIKRLIEDKKISAHELEELKNLLKGNDE